MGGCTEAAYRGRSEEGYQAVPDLQKAFCGKGYRTSGSGLTNDTSIAVIYKDGKDGAIVVTVDVASGKVDCFDRQSRGRAMRWIAPLDAGAGKG